VGIACLAWLAIDRPAITDLIPQALIATAFILWGIDLLMPAGPWATFFGAVVIAIYVFDLAWLMERSLRKKLGVRAIATFAGNATVDSNSTDVGRREGTNGHSREHRDEERRAAANTRSP
jgi:hypothetical protein